MVLRASEVTMVAPESMTTRVVLDTRVAWAQKVPVAPQVPVPESLFLWYKYRMPHSPVGRLWSWSVGQECSCTNCILQDVAQWPGLGAQAGIGSHVGSGAGTR